MESNAEPDSPAKSAGLFLAAVFGLLLLYVLSVGPVALVLAKSRSTPADTGSRIANTVYAPLIWLDGHSSLQRPIRAYINLWIR